MAFKKFENDREFGKLFAIKDFKQDYSNFINGIMRKLYQEEGKWGKLLSDGNYGVINTDYDLTKAFIYLEKNESGGLIKDVKNFYTKIYDNKDPRWSLLNYVNTHWSSFMHIVNTLNYWMDTGQIKNDGLLTFKNDYFEELDKMKYLITKTGKLLFFPDNKLTCFYKIMGAIAKSTYLGNLGECITLESLSNLGDVSDVIKSNPGQRLDTHGGVDLSFRLNGIKKTLQCKTFNKWYFVDSHYIFVDISNPKWYNVDYFSFVNSFQKSLFVFDTRKNGQVYKEKDGRYIFHEELLKYKIKL